MAWFEEVPSYVGDGRADFSSPPGFVEGPTTATFDGRGGAEITLEVERFGSAESLAFGVTELLSGTRDVLGAGRSLGIGPFRNPCSRLTVKTADGTFTANDGVIYGGGTFHPGGRESDTLRFHTIRSSFDVTGGTPPRFWALPLFNYAAEIVEWKTPVDGHPLRLPPVRPTRTGP
jgi:hypothetical protein